MANDRPPSPIGEALAWVSRITAIGLLMFLPGVAGGWLDDRLETRFLGPAGFVLGFVAGLTAIVGLRRDRTEDGGRGRPE